MGAREHVKPVQGIIKSFKIFVVLTVSLPSAVMLPAIIFYAEIYKRMVLRGPSLQRTLTCHFLMRC